MTREEKMDIAKQIAQCEKILSAGKDEVKMFNAMKTIEALTESITDIQDIEEIDIMIQSLLG